MDDLYKPSNEVVENAHINKEKYEEMYKESILNPIKFWGLFDPPTSAQGPAQPPWHTHTGATCPLFGGGGTPGHMHSPNTRPTVPSTT